jgi:hypothetical protein
MKTGIRFGLAIFAVALIGTPAWTTPTGHASLLQDQQDPAQSKTANGKVATVTDNFVTLNLKTGDGDPQTVQFSTDGNTKIEGKLAVGATALVEYHTDQDGKNMATRIVVQASK